jgi:hypothetical protein
MPTNLLQYVDNIRTLWENITLIGRALEIGRKVRLWRAFLSFFTATANLFYIYYILHRTLVLFEQSDFIDWEIFYYLWYLT